VAFKLIQSLSGASAPLNYNYSVASNTGLAIDSVVYVNASGCLAPATSLLGPILGVCQAAIATVAAVASAAQVPIVLVDPTQIWQTACSAAITNASLAFPFYAIDATNAVYVDAGVATVAATVGLYFHVLTTTSLTATLGGVVTGRFDVL
jgi:hypothetical protein